MSLTPTFTPASIGEVHKKSDITIVEPAVLAEADVRISAAQLLYGSGELVKTVPNAGAYIDDWAPATAGQWPTLRVSSKAGKPAISLGAFGSTKMYLPLNPITFPRTVFHVFRNVQDYATDCTPWNNYTGYIRNTRQAGAFGGRWYAYTFNGAAESYLSATSDAIRVGPHATILETVFSNTSSIFRINGEPIATATGTLVDPVSQLYPQIQSDEMFEHIEFPRALTSDERLQVLTYLNPKWCNLVQVICDGTSHTYPGASIGDGSDYPMQMLKYLAGNCSVLNFGLGGQQTPGITSDAVTQVDGNINPLVGNRRIVCLENGTNDFFYSAQTPASLWSLTKAYCDARHAAGFKVVLIPMMPAAHVSQPGDFTSNQTAYNALLAADHSFADGFVSTITADARLLSPTNTTYFQSDKLHLTPLGRAIYAQHVARVVNSITF